jgi:hypothetical protein
LYFKNNVLSSFSTFFFKFVVFSTSTFKYPRKTRQNFSRAPSILTTSAQLGDVAGLQPGVWRVRIWLAGYRSSIAADWLVCTRIQIWLAEFDSFEVPRDWGSFGKRTSANTRSFWISLVSFPALQLAKIHEILLAVKTKKWSSFELMVV